MRNKLYALTKPTIISARISDNELENVEKLMEETHMTASQIMRKAFLMLVERYKAGHLHGSEL